MVTLVRKIEQNLTRFKIHRPKCRNCDKDLYEYMQQKGTKVWRRGFASGYMARYYCDDCKKDIFGGVKLRKRYEK